MAKKIVNSKLALISGNSFQLLAEEFIHLAEKVHPENATEFAFKNLGHMIASATNMSLALELYLKGILTLNSVDYSETHDLSKLFKLLPETVACKIFKDFESRRKIQIGKVGCFHLYSNPSTINPDKKGDIKSVLKRTRNNFVVWRYLYESEEGKPKQDALYEFNPMVLAGSVLREHLKLMVEQNA